MAFRAAAFTLALTFTLAAAKVDYSHHQVYRFTPSTAAQHASLRAFFTAHDDGSLDWWRFSRTYADLRVAPGQKSLVRQFEAESGLNHTVHVQDVQALIDTETKPDKPENRRRAQVDPDPWTWAYHTYNETIEHFTKEVVPQYPSIASLVTLGYSYEGREQLSNSWPHHDATGGWKGKAKRRT